MTWVVWQHSLFSQMYTMLLTEMNLLTTAASVFLAGLLCFQLPLTSKKLADKASLRISFLWQEYHHLILLVCQLLKGTGALLGKIVGNQTGKVEIYHIIVRRHFLLFVARPKGHTMCWCTFHPIYVTALAAVPQLRGRTEDIRFNSWHLRLKESDN